MECYIHVNGTWVSQLARYDKILLAGFSHTPLVPYSYQNRRGRWVDQAIGFQELGQISIYIFAVCSKNGITTEKTQRDCDQLFYAALFWLILGGYGLLWFQEMEALQCFLFASKYKILEDLVDFDSLLFFSAFLSETLTHTHTPQVFWPHWNIQYLGPLFVDFQSNQ